MNDLLQYFAPNVAPSAAYAGTCATSAAQFTLSNTPGWLNSTGAVPTNISTPAYNGTVNAAGVTGSGATMNGACIVLPNTGNQVSHVAHVVALLTATSDPDKPPHRPTWEATPFWTRRQ